MFSPKSMTKLEALTVIHSKLHKLSAELLQAGIKKLQVKRPAGKQVKKDQQVSG
jgi:hypothetical protein